MKICIAQIRPVKGNIPANIDNHTSLIHLAVSLKADAIFFPELSITGYEPALAKDLATDQNDKRFDGFQHISNTHAITVGIGMPAHSTSGIRISMLVFQPDRPRQSYSKQQLHPDEFPYFVSGTAQTILTVKDTKIAPAICYESLQPGHADNANKLGAEMYVASVAKSQRGIDRAFVHYPGVAKKYSMPVLMANCVGYCDNFESAGKSSVWNQEGIVAGQLDDRSEGILLYDMLTEEVIERVI